MEEQHKFSLKRLLFGKINRKLIFSFSILFFLIIVISCVGYYYSDGNFGQKMIILSFIVTLSILIIIFFLISCSISGPLGRLYKAIGQTEKGNFDSRVDIRTGDELELLGDSFNKTLDVLKERAEEHKQLDHAKTEFLSITSHELRSPMTPMRAQLQMLLGEYFGKLNKEQKEALDIVLRNTIRLDRIIMDFLDVSRIEAARLKFKFIKVDLADYIERLIEEMAGFMPEKKIKVKLEMDKLPKIEADPDRVMQVLRNLINNAKKFSPENSKIFINVRLQEKRILFSVRDQGIGISPEFQKRVFEPFFQADQTMYNKKSGTGLGLSICRGIVESQNGRLWVESEKGKGSCFYFTVPLKPVKEIKPIRLLFSPKADLERKVKEVSINYLGPLGGQEFEILNQQDLNYEFIVKRINELKEEHVIDEDTESRMIREMKYIYNVGETKGKINLPEEIKKLYINQLGPLGEKRFNEIGEFKLDKIIGNINGLEKVGVISIREASSFRDNVMSLFRQKSIEDERENLGKKVDK